MGGYVAIHEAGHAVTGYLLGMEPVEIRAVLEDEPCTVHDQSRVAELLSRFHSDVERMWCVVRSVHLVAGGCAEALVGRPPDECAWKGDERLYTPLLTNLEAATGVSYAFYLDAVTRVAMEALGKPAVWKTTRMLASALETRKALAGPDAVRIMKKWLGGEFGWYQRELLAECAALLPSNGPAV